MEEKKDVKPEEKVVKVFPKLREPTVMRVRTPVKTPVRTPTKAPI